MDEINLTIDGIEVRVQKGTTVLQAAQSVGIYIPSLCSHPDLPSSREAERSEISSACRCVDAYRYGGSWG